MDFPCVELEAFTRELLRVADEEVLREFQLALAARPEAGDLIRHSGGLRKARMKLSGRGKSGGAGVIDLWLPRWKPSSNNRTDEKDRNRIRQQ